MQLKTIEELVKVIEEQNRLILKLINDNAEKESLIEVLMAGFKTV